jgi:flagellar hook-associated protein 1 FlgK
MSGLIDSLLSGSQSLSTQSQGIELVGKNLANSNSPTYARQRLVVGQLGSVETPIGTQSMGTQAVGIQQIRDQYLDGQMIREISGTSLLSAQDGFLERAQADLGEQVDSTLGSASLSDPTHATNGISSAINDFFNAAQALSANPNEPGAKQVLLQKADILATKFNVADSRLAQLQTDIASQNQGDLGVVNGLLKDIASLNNQIQKEEINDPNSAPDLRDQRQAKLEELAKFIDISASEIHNGHGQIQVSLKGQDGKEVLLVDKTSVLGGVSYDENTRRFSGGLPPSALRLDGGSLQGNLLARDGAIQQLRDNLKAVAQQLSTSVNNAYNPTGSSSNFFQVSPAAGLIALDPSLTLASLKTSSDGSAGGNDLALALAGVADKQHSVASGDGIDGTISGFYSSMAGNFGLSVSSVQSKLADQQTVQNLVSSQRDSVSGVSQDEELTNLMKYQRGFQASARVINVIDNLLDLVVNGLVKS